MTDSGATSVPVNLTQVSCSAKVEPQCAQAKDVTPLVSDAAPVPAVRYVQSVVALNESWQLVHHDKFQLMPPGRVVCVCFQARMSDVSHLTPHSRLYNMK